MKPTMERYEHTCLLFHFLVFFLTGSSRFASGWNLTRSEFMQVSSNRQVYAVVFVPVHQKGGSAFSCGPANGSDALYQLSTISYAFNDTNEVSLLRTGITLGAYVIDYCSQPVRAVTLLYQLLSGGAYFDNGSPIDPRTIVAVISLETEVSNRVKELLEPLHIPLFAGIMKPEWKIPTPETSNEIRLSTESSEWIQAVAAFLQGAKIGFVSLLVAGEYGERAKDALLSLLDSRICNVNSFHLTPESEMKSLARTILAGSQGHVLIVLADDARLVITFLKIYGTVSGQSSVQLFVINDELLSLKTVQALDVHVLLVGSGTQSASDGLQKFVKTLTVSSHKPINDDWFRELWQYHFRCTLSPTSSWPLCTGSEGLDDNFTVSPAMDYTLLAIKTLSLGFQNFITRNCPKRDQIQTVEECGVRARSSLMAHIKKALAGDERRGERPLAPTSDALRFRLHYRRSNRLDDTDFREVGSWDNGSVSVVEGVEHALRRAGVVDFPCVDACARACPDKAVKMMATDVDVDVGANFRETWGLVTASLSALGIMFVVGCFAYFLVVIPTSRGTTVLNYVILVGLFGVFGVNFAFIAAATEIVCSVRRLLMGVAYAVVFSATLVKVVNIWRTSRHPSSTSSSSSTMTTSCVAAQQAQEEVKPAFILFVAVGVALFQGGIAIAWLVLSPSRVVRVDTAILCSPGVKFEEALVLSMTYVMFLMALTLLFSTLTWKYETNHRESRWILLSTVLSCLCWLLWTLISTQGNVASKNPAIVIGNVLCAWSIIVSLYFPKLYLYSKLLNQAKKLDIRAFYPHRDSFRGHATVSTLYDPLHPTSTLNSNYSSLSGTLGTTMSDRRSKKRRPPEIEREQSTKRPPPQDRYPRPVYDGRSQFSVETAPSTLSPGVNHIKYSLPPNARTVHNPGAEYF